MNKNVLAGFSILNVRSDFFVDFCLESIEKKRKMLIFFANTNFVVQCFSSFRSFKRDDVYILNDGIGIDIATYLTRQDRFLDNLNGTDFHINLTSRSGRPLRLFLLGAAPGVALRASDFFAAYGQDIVGVLDGFTGIKQFNIVDLINASQADVLLVALGNPRQEQWILEHADQLNVPLITGVGALFDFYSGDKQRAPIWVQRIHMEWFFRLSLEPKRLLKRYTIDLFKFLYLCMSKK